MMPLYFGPSARALYGVYDPAAGGLSRRGVVVCSPMGAEYYQAHSVCRSLARRLAESGIHVLRFDYLGTGDSAREMEDVRADDWLDDVELATQELRDMASLPTVGVIGIRGGGTLALAAAASGSDLDRIALWDPIPTEFTELNGFDVDPARLPSRALMVSTGQDPEWAAKLWGPIASDRPDSVRVDHDERGPWDVQAVGPGSVPIPVGCFDTIVEWAGAT